MNVDDILIHQDVSITMSEKVDIVTFSSLLPFSEGHRFVCFTDCLILPDKFQRQIKGEPWKLLFSSLFKCHTHNLRGAVLAVCMCASTYNTQKQIRQTWARISSLAFQPSRLQTRLPSPLQHEIQGCRGGFCFLV